jgi:CRISPR/Cas system-associated exonuclease Cas4 (RecB family)
MVSPSLAKSIELCPLTAVFEHDLGFRNLSRRRSHFAALGEICHALWEREGRGDFDDVPDDDLGPALNDAWDKAEAKAITQLQDSLGGTSPPPSSRWPDYLVKRLGALALIKKSVRARRGSDRQPSGAPPLVEDAIEAVEAPLRGRPDRVIWFDGVAHIIDLKTCAPESEIRPEHRRQLLAYAYLFHERHKVWPATGTIQYVNGERQSFQVSPAEAQEVAQRMVRTLETVNTSTDEVLDLATPSADACRWCSFKAACSPFFASVDESWELHERDILGTVQGIEAAERRSSVTIHVTLGNVGESHVVALADSPAVFSGVTVGDKLAIVGARPTRSPTTIHCAWDSIVCVWAG